MEIDFTISRNDNFCCINPKVIIFRDISVYNKAPISPKLHVKFPDFNKEYTTSIQYGETNILNTERLGFTDCSIEFPDGVYTLTYEVNNRGCEIKKKVFITSQAWYKLSEWLNNVDINNKETLEKFNKINLYLHAAESGVCSNQSQSEALYKQAETLLKCVDVVKTK